MSHQTKHIMPLSFSLLIAGTNGAQAVNPQSQEPRCTAAALGRAQARTGTRRPARPSFVWKNHGNQRQLAGIGCASLANTQGNWIVEFLLPGPYRFTVKAPGFRTAQRGGVTLQTADDKEIDVQLEVGATTESVEVSSGTPLIDTTSATSGTVITSEELNELPTSSHVVTLFATLSPGLVAQYKNNNVAHLWSFNAASQFEANGGRNNIYSIS